MRAGRGKRRDRARLFGAIAVIVIAGCASPATPPDPPETAPTGSHGQTLEPSVEPSQTLEPSPSLIAAGSPTTTPTSTPLPTPRPTATPQPQPTLDWADAPIGVSVTPDPAILGAKVKVTVSVAAGPTCTLKVKYPSGSTASLPKPTRPKPTSWVWTWTLPESAGGGTATATVTCTYGGVARGGPGTFPIVDPTPEWSISADLPDAQPATQPPPASSNILYATITVSGQVPTTSAYAQQRFHCTLRLVANGYTVNAGDQVYVSNFDAPIEMGFSVGMMPTASIGTAAWTMTCENLYIEPQDTRQDSGTIEIT